MLLNPLYPIWWIQKNYLHKKNTFVELESSLSVIPSVLRITIIIILYIIGQHEVRLPFYRHLAVACFPTRYAEDGPAAPHFRRFHLRLHLFPDKHGRRERHVQWRHNGPRAG